MTSILEAFVKILYRLAVYVMAVMMMPYFFALGIRELWRSARRARSKRCGAAIERVRDIHLMRDDDLCRECLDDYPCATRRALDG